MTKSKSFARLLFALFIVALPVLEARADTLTFDSSLGTVLRYEEDGLRLRSVPTQRCDDESGLPCIPEPFLVDGRLLIFSDRAARLTRVGGGAFDLLSLDVRFTLDEGEFSLTGYRGSTQVAQTSGQELDLPVFCDPDVEQGACTFEGTAVFGAEFQGITSLVIDGEFDGVRLDNLTFQTNAVPEPATMLLLSTGLAGIGAVVRRRRQDKGK